MSNKLYVPGQSRPGRVKIGTYDVPEAAVADFLQKNAASLGIRPRTRGSVMFAVPSMETMFSWWALPFMDLLLEERQPSDRFAYVVGSLVAYARNDLVRIFLSQTKCEYMMWVDNDTLPPAGWTTTLANHGKDITTGLVHVKKSPFPPLLYKDPTYNEKTDKWDYKWYEKIPDHGLLEVAGCGAGCLLVSRKVFETVEDPWFKEVGGGEDFYFCRKAQEKGFKIYADPEVQCTHITTAGIGTGHWLAEQALRKQELAESGNDVPAN